MWWITAAVLMAVCFIVYISLYLTNIMSEAPVNSTMKTSEIVFLGLGILFLVIWVIVFAIEWSKIRKEVHEVLCKTGLGSCEEKKKLGFMHRRNRLNSSCEGDMMSAKKYGPSFRECVNECSKIKEDERRMSRNFEAQNFEERSPRNFEAQNFEERSPRNFENRNFEAQNFQPRPSRDFSPRNFSPEKIGDLESRDFVSPSF